MAKDLLGDRVRDFEAMLRSHVLRAPATRALRGCIAPAAPLFPSQNPRVARAISDTDPMKSHCFKLARYFDDVMCSKLTFIHFACLEVHLDGQQNLICVLCASWEYEVKSMPRRLYQPLTRVELRPFAEP